MKLSYQIFNKYSANWIIGFYGFGQDAVAFNSFNEIIKHKYSFVVVDLNYDETNEFWQKKDFLRQVKDLLFQLNIDTFIGISYSVGSRFNLCLAEMMPEKFNTMFLIAPDGVKIGFWNHVATNNQLGRFLFCHLIENPFMFEKTIKLIESFNLIPRSLAAFAKWHMRNLESRKKIYAIWMNMRKLTPDLKKIGEASSKYNFPIIAYFGTMDVVIDKSYHEKLKKMIPKSQIILLKQSHNMLNDDLFNDIASKLI